jgi:hypothetical protein
LHPQCDPLYHILFNPFIHGTTVDKHYSVRAEFEKTGHLTAWQKLKSHNRKSKTRIAVPESFDAALVKCELKKMASCDAAYKAVEKKQEEGFFLELVFHFMRRKLWHVLEDFTCLRVLKQIARGKKHISRDIDGWESSGHQPRTIMQGLLHYLFGKYRVPAFMWNLFWTTDCPYRFLNVVYLMMGKSVLDLPDQQGAGPSFSARTRRCVTHQGVSLGTGIPIRRWSGAVSPGLQIPPPQQNC